jgi:hypothetical protein
METTKIIFVILGATPLAAVLGAISPKTEKGEKILTTIRIACFVIQAIGVIGIICMIKN